MNPTAQIYATVEKLVPDAWWSQCINNIQTIQTLNERNN